MNKWILAPTFAAILATSGCMSTGNDQQAATMDRNQAIASLSTEMEELGFNKVEIQPGVDDVLNICASVLERQYSVMEQYRTQAENHADVQAFLFAHKDKKPEQLKLAIAEFDAGATKEDEKIGPKINAYQAAIDEVADQNAELAIEIGKHLVQVGYLTTEYGPQIAQMTAANTLKSMFGSEDEKTADNDLVKAIVRAKDQIMLARDANKLITLEQETIEAIDGLQAELDAKS
ncbi:hypothetical protein [Idiomarina seosinensis]|uniref:DUF3053 domain-containing protein n=1 Tax=Idiomarina seosinensis TaxID=281739 RepID=A0A432ZCR8_9GAMM|nr:hypothetical protein [Idiomarina seosinensis]RUO75767.1 hypothetical protein CWI81_06450 [Idiomarina seosinensis]